MELVHPNIYSIYELLEHMEKPVLQEQMSFLNSTGPRPTSAASLLGVWEHREGVLGCCLYATGIKDEPDEDQQRLR